MGKVIRLTESDLLRLVKRVINESSNEEDVKGKKCESCGKGTYKETEPMDDLRGTLHCSKCDKMVDRYKKYTPFKKKSNKLSESDLVRMVKMVINEEKDNMIKIPNMFKSLKRVFDGEPTTPSKIINLYNDYVEEGIPLVSYSDGEFYNEEDMVIPVNVVLNELNYAIAGGEDDDREDDDM